MDGRFSRVRSATRPSLAVTQCEEKNLPFDVDVDDTKPTRRGRPVLRRPRAVLPPTVNQSISRAATFVRLNNEKRASARGASVDGVAVQFAGPDPSFVRTKSKSPSRARIRGVAVSIASHRDPGYDLTGHEPSETTDTAGGRNLSIAFRLFYDAPRVSDKLHMSDCSYRNRTRFTSIDSSIGSIHPPSRARDFFSSHGRDARLSTRLDSGGVHFNFQFSIFNFRGKIQVSRAPPARASLRVVRGEGVVRRPSYGHTVRRSALGFHHPRARTRRRKNRNRTPPCRWNRYLFCFPTHPT